MAAHRLRKLGQWRISNHRPPKVWISMMFSQKAKNICVYLCDSSYILPLDPPAKLSTVPKMLFVVSRPITNRMNNLIMVSSVLPCSQTCSPHQSCSSTVVDFERCTPVNFTSINLFLYSDHFSFCLVFLRRIGFSIGTY